MIMLYEPMRAAPLALTSHSLPRQRMGPFSPGGKRKSEGVLVLLSPSGREGAHCCAFAQQWEVRAGA